MNVKEKDEIGDKKYYSISEVAEFLNIRAHQLRYLEQIIPNYTIYKIHNRRYYTKTNIKDLQNYMVSNITNKSLSSKLESTQLVKIDNLIKKFYQLSIKIHDVLDMYDKKLIN